MLRVRFFLLAFLTITWSATSWSQGIKGTYAIKNVVTEMLLRPLEASNKNKTPIVAYSPTNWKCMTWDFSQVEGNVYNLRNLLTNKTFQPSAVKPSEGTPLEQQPADGQSTLQQWEFIPVENSAFLIRLKDSELYVTPSEESGSSNSKIILAAKRTDKLQHWTIYVQHPTM